MGRAATKSSRIASRRADARPERGRVIVDHQTGEGTTLASDKVISLTHPVAEAHLNLAVVPGGERPCSDKWIKTLVQQMQSKNFRSELVQLAEAYIEGDGRIYRINAQHTCWARLELPATDEFDYKVRKLSYVCADEAALRRLYASYDRGRARTEAHVVRVNLLGTEGFDKFGNQSLQAVKAGFKLWRFPGNRKTTPDELANLLANDFAAVASKVGVFLEAAGKDGRFIRRSGIVAAMFETFVKAPRIAEFEFWPVVRDGVVKGGETKATDPRVRLSRELLSTITCQKGATRSAGNQVRVASSEEIFRACIRAWNAFRRQEPLKNLRFAGSGTRPKAK